MMEEENIHNSLERSIGRLEGTINALNLNVSKVANDVSSLRNDFATMEKGRLTALEVKFASLSSEIKTKTQFSSFWTSVFTSLAVGLIVAVSTYYITHR